MIVPITADIKQCLDTLSWICNPANIRHASALNLNSSDISSRTANTRFTAPRSWSKLLSSALEYLHLYRMTNQMDTVGHGWYPGLSEPTIIVSLNDGGPLLSDPLNDLSDLQLTDKFELPGSQLPGCSYYRAPFRWDQRLYNFRFKDIASQNNPLTDLDKSLNSMAMDMNGSFYEITSLAVMKDVCEKLTGVEKKNIISGSSPLNIPRMFPTGVTVAFNTVHISKGVPSKPHFEVSTLQVERHFSGSSSAKNHIGSALVSDVLYNWGWNPLPLNYPSTRDMLSARRFVRS